MLEKLKNEIYSEAIIKARELMKKQTEINKAPSWYLTELAIDVGEKLAIEYEIDKNIVILTLYLMHLVFDPITGGEIQRNHFNLSADYVIQNKLLEKWKIPEEDKDIIINAIRLHHTKKISDNLIIEVIKNSECQKFVTIEGALIWLHELGLRGYDFEKSKELVFYKMNQKRELLTLEKCIKNAEISCKKIEEMFLNKNTNEKLKELHEYGLNKVPYSKINIEDINLRSE